MYKNKKIFVLGMARSGYEVAKLLASDNEIFITDMKEQDEDKINELTNLGVNFEISDKPDELLDNSYDIVIKNPGIKYSHPCVVKAKQLGISVINEVEVAYHYIDKSVNIIGITGSNGKTTTTSLIYEIMKEAYGDKVILAGNIGIPLSRLVKDIKKDSYLVTEISVQQLYDMYDFKTDVSVMTNLYDCHADFCDGHETYVNIKKKIFMNHSKEDIAIINKDNAEVMSVTQDIESSKQYFTKNGVGDCYYKDGFIYYKDEAIIDTDKIILKGEHNYENIMCAILACKVYDVDNKIIQEVVSGFGGVEHRLEYVGTINGRQVYNDSKSTNVESTKIALSSFDKSTILILGGLDRGHSFDELANYMKNVLLVVCYGETKHRINDFCNRIGVSSIICDNLVEATNIAYDNSKSGNVILLSPACASWDQFTDFEARGKLFKDTILSIQNKSLSEQSEQVLMTESVGEIDKPQYKGLFKGAKTYYSSENSLNMINDICFLESKENINCSWLIFQASTYVNNADKDSLLRTISIFDNVIVIDDSSGVDNKDDIVKEIKKYGKEAFYISNYNDIKLYMSQYVKENDVILFVGNVSNGIFDVLINE